MGGWKSYEYTEYGPDGTAQKETANASFYHAFDILIVIKITLAAIFIYSVQYTLNRAGATGFQSNGNIKITVTKGGTNFKNLNDAGTVQITSITGTIKKSPAFTNGTSEQLTKDTKLYIEAKGEISTPITAEVTIKADLTVNSEGKPLGSEALTLGPDTNKDPSSQGLGGSITPEGTGGPVQIKNTSTITLRDKALKALQSLTQNAVTLSPSTGTFRSSASITVTRTSGTANFKTLTVDGSNPFTIDISGGTIKRYDNEGRAIDLKTEDNLPVDTKLLLDATGKIKEPTEAKDTNVTLTGTIVVTSNDQKIGDSLKFGGGPNRGGVNGTLTLNASGNITAGSLEINEAAYTTIKQASDTTSSSFTIGAADPRVPANATGAPGLNNEDSFTKYWHLLPPNKYDKSDLPHPDVISPALMVLLVATIFPPMMVVILQKVPSTKPYNPKSFERSWDNEIWYWHLFDILIVIKISLAAIFIYSLNYGE